MASAYLVTLASGHCGLLQNKVNGIVCYANSSADAIALAKSSMQMDANTLWDTAVVTAIGAPTDYAGFRFTVKETYPSGSVGRTADITMDATGGTNDTIDKMGTALATALGGGAAYTTSTQVLLLSASGKGDNSLEVNVYPPVAVGQTFGIPGFLGAFVHNGANGSALSFALCADNFAAPNLLTRCTIVK